MAVGRKKPQKSSLEGLLLLGLVVSVFLFICTLLLFRHPAGSVLFPLQVGSAFSDAP